jgi:hypothetical protein
MRFFVAKSAPQNDDEFLMGRKRGGASRWKLCWRGRRGESGGRATALQNGLRVFVFVGAPRCGVMWASRFAGGGHSLRQVVALVRRLPVVGVFFAIDSRDPGVKSRSLAALRDDKRRARQALGAREGRRRLLPRALRAGCRVQRFALDAGGCGKAVAEPPHSTLGWALLSPRTLRDLFRCGLRALRAEAGISWRC